MAASKGVDPELVGAWAAGWARSRGVAPPKPSRGGWYIRVGLSDQKARFVFPALDSEDFSALAHAIAEPAVLLKVCAPPEEVAPLLPARWQIGARSFFMTVPAANMGGSVSLTAGYRLKVERETWGLLATVTSRDGGLAARGRLLLDGGWAVFDRIETEEVHRRRGLGTTVMRALQLRALDAGVRGGLLVATADGQRLYRSLGWQSLSDHTSAAIPFD